MKQRVILPDNASVTFLHHNHEGTCKNTIAVVTHPIGRPAVYCAAPMERKGINVRRTTTTKNIQRAFHR